MERWKSRIRADPGTQRTTGDPGDPGTGTGDRPATPAAGNGCAGGSEPLHCRFTGFHRLFSVKKPIRWLFFWTTCSGWTPILSSWWNGSLRIRRGNLCFSWEPIETTRWRPITGCRSVVEVIKKTGQPLQTIPLKPLDPENISQLLVHTCHCRA